MATLGCALCKKRVNVDIEEHQPNPVCADHPARVLVDWKRLEEAQFDSWLGVVLDDRYELHRTLGHGGFGAVYYAVQRGHIRNPVAVKILTRQNPEYVDLFRDEMRVVSRLRCPHTVRYLASGTHILEMGGNIPYMVMEFIEGETLAHRIIQSGALPPHAVIELLKQLLLSLKEAHEHGIIHRDLKPLNLMLSPQLNGEERLVVLDFGVARLVEEASRDATRDRIMGTPYYISPETLTHQAVTHQTDLFAAAVIAYEALCCRSPFLNEELKGIEPYIRLRTIYRDKSKPEPLPAHFSREWTLFFECALSTDPEARFPNATSMMIAVDELSERIKHKQPQQPTAEDDFAEEEATTLFKRQLVIRGQKRLQTDHRSPIEGASSADRAADNSAFDSITELSSVYEDSVQIPPSLHPAQVIQPKEGLAPQPSRGMSHQYTPIIQARSSVPAPPPASLPPASLPPASPPPASPPPASPLVPPPLPMPSMAIHGQPRNGLQEVPQRVSVNENQGLLHSPSMQPSDHPQRVNYTSDKEEERVTLRDAPIDVEPRQASYPINPMPYQGQLHLNPTTRMEPSDPNDAPTVNLNQLTPEERASLQNQARPIQLHNTSELHHEKLSGARELIGLLIQLVLMVMLGALFAYIVIKYVLV